VQFIENISCKILIQTHLDVRILILLGLAAKNRKPRQVSGAFSISKFNCSKLKVINRQHVSPLVCGSYAKTGLDKLFPQMSVYLLSDGGVRLELAAGPAPPVTPSWTA
jgi:hypothetical protein